MKSEDGEDEVLSDVCVVNTAGTGCTIFNDVVNVSIENMPKTDYLLTSDLNDVQITKYQVYYVRRDEGTEVPPPISHRVSWWIPIDETQTFSFSIVTHEQKLLPPLDALSFFELGYDPETGNSTIETDAHVYFTGQTRSGCKIAIDAYIPIKFADFAD
jgi:hypothetical protein